MLQKLFLHPYHLLCDFVMKIRNLPKKRTSKFFFFFDISTKCHKVFLISPLSSTQKRGSSRDQGVREKHTLLYAESTKKLDSVLIVKIIFLICKTAQLLMQSPYKMDDPRRKEKIRFRLDSLMLTHQREYDNYQDVSWGSSSCSSNCKLRHYQITFESFLWKTK